MNLPYLNNLQVNIEKVIEGLNTEPFNLHLNPLNSEYSFYENLHSSPETIAAILNTIEMGTNYNLVTSSPIMTVIFGSLSIISFLAGILHNYNIPPEAINIIQEIIPIHYPETLFFYRTLEIDVQYKLAKEFFESVFEGHFNFNPYLEPLRWRREYEIIVPFFNHMYHVGDSIVYIYKQLQECNNEPSAVEALLKDTPDPIRRYIITYLSIFFEECEKSFEFKMSLFNGLTTAIKLFNRESPFLYHWDLSWIDANLIIRDPGLHEETILDYAYNTRYVFRHTELLNITNCFFFPTSLSSLMRRHDREYQLQRLYNYIYNGIITNW
jgi:hypothetical protein